MGMFQNLMDKIFRHPSAAPTSAPEAPATPDAAAAGGGASTTASTTTTTQPIAAVDVAAILDRMASESAQKLDWKHSIVDLMKLVGMDSSLSARRELAADLEYKGDTSDTATMNMWLHKEVMNKLAQNGGTVPRELLSR